MGTILKTKDLTKKYDNKVVVDNLNIEIQEGEIFGLLGPNGAGKSTTMNMICGIVRPTLGDVEFMEKDFLKNRKKLIESHIKKSQSTYAEKYTYYTCKRLITQTCREEQYN